MSDKKLLDQRNRLKKKKPDFTRRNWNCKRKIEKGVWRKPRGTDNKLRLKKKGHMKNPSSGFRSPLEVRGLNSYGLKPIVVSNSSQLTGLTKEHGVIIASSLGNKKRIMLIEETKKKGLMIINLDAEKTLSAIEAGFKERQADKKKKLEEKDKKSIEEKVKKEKKDKKPEEKKEHEKKEELSDEDKKKLENQEKNKVLTQRE